jgi:MFS family permease
MTTTTSNQIVRTYLALMLTNTLASSLIWGINTIFLLDAGLSNTQAFLANSFFTVGQVLFEIPTGIVADVQGRRFSYMLGALTLAVCTLLYLGAWQIHAPMWIWAISSILLGLGFTFFSGATEAWLVDALKFSDHKGSLDAVFGKGQMMSGLAMLIGSVSGGVIAQLVGLSAPYILRVALLFVNFAIAFMWMKDLGFTPVKSTHVVKDIRDLFTTSIDLGWRKPAVRWIMLAAPFTAGVGFYAFYAMQPYLLDLYQNDKAYAIAGVGAAIVAGAQIVGGMSVGKVRTFFKTRTTLLITSIVLNTLLLILIGLNTNFWIAIVLMSGWGLVFAATQPVRQAYLNGQIPSAKRATVLSFDNSISSAGGAVVQPILGRSADMWSYGASFIVGGVFSAIALPFTFLAKREKVEADTI